MADVTEIKPKSKKVPLTGREKVLLSRLAVMESALVERRGIASMAGITFSGDRDLYEELGYKRELSTEDYWDRFHRNGVARKLVKAFPDATWRGTGGDLVEDEDPGVVTQFEDPGVVTQEW